MKYIFHTVLALVFGNVSVSAQQWIHYNTNNTPIMNNRAWPIAIDNNGDKWFGFDLGAGVSEFNNISWTNYPSTSGAPSSVRCIEFDNNNNLWASGFCATGRIWKFDGVSWTMFDNSNAPFSIYDEVSEIYVDNNNNIWFCTSQTGLIKYDGSSWTVYDPGNSAMPSYCAVSITQDSNGIYWIGTWPYWNGNFMVGGGLAKFDGINFTVYDTSNSLIPSNVTYNVRCDNTDKVWFLSGSGITAFDNAVFTQYTTGNSPLSNDTINVFEIDAANNIWAGSPQGLIKFNASNAVLYSVLNADTVKGVNDIEIDSYNNIWLTYGWFDPICYSGHGITAFNENAIMGRSEERDNDLMIKIYPNPISDEAMMAISGNVVTVDFVLYDQLGREVRRIDGIEGNAYVLSREGISNGMYFYKVFRSKTHVPVAAGKIVIQ
jgi:hypothetical protein